MATTIRQGENRRFEEHTASSLNRESITPVNSDSSPELNLSVAIGVLLMVGGVVASAATGRLCYGAVIIGLIMIVKGVVK